MLFTTIILFGIIYLVSTQLSSFYEKYPILVEKFNTKTNEFIHWFSVKFNIKDSTVNSWITDTKKESIKNFKIGERLTDVGHLIVNGLLLPVYIFMILYYKSLLLEFISKLFRMEHHEAVIEVLVNTKKIIQSYLSGLFIEMLIIAVMNTAGLFILGIEYAIILGIISAVLNIIPYLGGIIGVVIFMLVALLTKEPIYMVYVAILYSVIQFIDNNYIIPKVVSSRVKINALVSVIVVLIGGAIWGIPGMFLSIPLTAIVKVIFDHIDSLKPWGFLLGNIVPTSSKFSFRKIISKKVTLKI